VNADRGAYVVCLLETAGCALFACAFLGVFALRMRTEFHGENLSDAANGVSRKQPEQQPALSSRALSASEPQQKLLSFSSTVRAAFAKEFLYMRRNSGMFYGMIAPVVMVILFAGKLSARQSGWWIFPVSLAYTMIGLAPLAYNSFGLEGAGSQFYFLAPAPLRAVFLAKNLMAFLMAAVEGFTVWLIFSWKGQPPSFAIILVSIFWVVGTLLLSVTVGNFRSISAPKKINLNRTANKQASPLSALLSIGILLLTTAFGGGILFGARFLELSWLFPVLVMMLYAAAGLIVYIIALGNVDQYALDRRESLFEELCKQ
jgi:ABC-2 type transport system permease protein